MKDPPKTHSLGVRNSRGGLWGPKTPLKSHISLIMHRVKLVGRTLIYIICKFQPFCWCGFGINRKKLKINTILNFDRTFQNLQLKIWTNGSLNVLVRVILTTFIEGCVTLSLSV